MLIINLPMYIYISNWYCCLIFQVSEFCVMLGPFCSNTLRKYWNPEIFMNIYLMNIRERLYWSKVKEWVIYEIITEFLCSLTPRPMAYLLEYTSSLASHVALVVRNPPTNAGDVRTAGSILGSGRSPGREHANPL